MKELLGDALPDDHARQTLADRYAEREIGRPSGGPWRVLDLGCGAGGSVDVFRARDPDVQWVGLDVPGSPEARERTRTDARFETFDGVSMPFEDGAFDLDTPRKYWMDTILTCNAPFFGEVISLSEPFACYRIHAANLYRPTVADAEQFTRMLNYFAHEIEYFTRRCRSWGVPFDPVAARNHSLWALECRLIADKLAYNNSPAVTDSSHHSARILFRALRVCVRARLPMLTRIIRAGWLISIAISPKSIARRLIALRFIPSARPA